MGYRGDTLLKARVGETFFAASGLTSEQTIKVPAANQRVIVTSLAWSNDSASPSIVSLYFGSGKEATSGKTFRIKLPADSGLMVFNFIGCERHGDPGETLFWKNGGSGTIYINVSYVLEDLPT